jgi:hypothetical protein
MSRAGSIGCAAASMLAVIVAYVLGDTYIARLPNHAGYFLVSVEDRVETPIDPPRHAVLILIDGLGRAPAEKLRAVERMRAQGQCRSTDVGALTVSRPVYAVVSTGLEQDRTGSRNNDEISPLAAESIFEASRRAGRKVHGISTERFWEQLFPRGFDDYQEIARPEDSFARAVLAQLTLIHPLYVDDAGHAHGAASQEYAEAVARADREVNGLLDRLDLERDLVIFTADHGHTSYRGHGGHGGPQRELRSVLTCFAGRSVKRSTETEELDSRSIAPALALLTGVPFPKNMRALEDDLDVIFDIADTSSISSAYLAERRAAVEKFRTENRAQLERWLGDAPGSWSKLYDRERDRQHLRLAIALLAIAGAAWWVLRRSSRPIGSLLWCGAIAATTCALFAWLRGSLDFTAINTRAEFLRAGFSVAACVAIVALIAHRLLWKDSTKLLADQLLLIGLTLGACLAHPVAYGWPIGFPLPSAEMLFFPFLAPIFLLVHAAIGALLSLIRAVRGTSASSPP